VPAPREGDRSTKQWQQLSAGNRSCSSNIGAQQVADRLFSYSTRFSRRSTTRPLGTLTASGRLPAPAANAKRARALNRFLRGAAPRLLIGWHARLDPAEHPASTLAVARQEKSAVRDDRALEIPPGLRGVTNPAVSREQRGRVWSA